MNTTHIVKGYYETNGNGPYPYKEPINTVIHGNSLRDADGFAWAVKDEYGDFVSPSMLRMGIKAKIEVEEASHD